MLIKLTPGWVEDKVVYDYGYESSKDVATLLPILQSYKKNYNSPRFHDDRCLSLYAIDKEQNIYAGI